MPLIRLSRSFTEGEEAPRPRTASSSRSGARQPVLRAQGLNGTSWEPQKALHDEHATQKGLMAASRPRGVRDPGQVFFAAVLALLALALGGRFDVPLPGHRLMQACFTTRFPSRCQAAPKLEVGRQFMPFAVIVDCAAAART